MNQNNRELFLLIQNMGNGGQERFVATLSNILSCAFSIKIITIEKCHSFYPINCDLIALKDSETKVKSSFFKKVFELFKRRRTLIRLFKKYHPFACISFGVGANRLNIESRYRGIKTYISIRSYKYASNYVSNSLDSYCIKKSDGVICVTKQIQSYLQKVFPCFSKKIYYLYNAYNIDAILKEVSNINKLSSCDGVVRIISVGRITTEKGYWHLLKAFFLVREKCKNTILEVFGYKQDLRHFKALTNLMEKLGIGDSFFFRDNTTEPFKIMAQRDIFVLSSVFEGFPNVVVEAMTCGLPIIADDCLSGPREIFGLGDERVVDRRIDFEYGFLTKALSIEENYDETVFEESEIILANAIIELVNDKTKRLAFGESARKRASTFSFDRCFKTINKILEK